MGPLLQPSVSSIRKRRPQSRRTFLSAGKRKITATGSPFCRRQQFNGAESHRILLQDCKSPCWPQASVASHVWERDDIVERGRNPKTSSRPHPQQLLHQQLPTGEQPQDKWPEQPHLRLQPRVSRAEARWLWCEARLGGQGAESTVRSRGKDRVQIPDSTGARPGWQPMQLSEN